MMRNLKIVLLVWCCLGTLNVHAQKSFALKQNFPIGKKYSFSISSDQIIKQKIGEHTINLTQNIGTDYTFSIRNGDNLEKDIEVVYNRIFMKSVAMGNTTTMDSDDADSTKQNPFLGMKGATFNMVMEPNGNVKSIIGIDKMVTDIATKMVQDSASIQKVKDALAKQFNAEVMKQTMQSSLKVYPNKSVKIGESWVIESKMEMTMPIEITTKYTLKAVKAGIAYLSLNGTMISKGKFETMGNNMETNLTGTNGGDAELDMETGLILKSHLRIEMMGTMNSMGQNIDFELHGINKVVGKELK